MAATTSEFCPLLGTDIVEGEPITCLGGDCAFFNELSGECLIVAACLRILGVSAGSLNYKAGTKNTAGVGLEEAE